MKLNLEDIHLNRMAYLAAGYELPTFDYNKVRRNTLESPKWIHFGPGNLFKAFPAHVAQTLLNSGRMDTGLIVAEGYDYEIIEKSSRPLDNLCILVTLHADNTIEKTAIASIMESLILDSDILPEFTRLQEIFANPTLQMASFTITEKGYSVKDSQGAFLPSVALDLINGPEKPQSYLGKVAALLYHRFKTCQAPIAMVSMDNCSHNGDLLKNAISTFAKEWCRSGLADKGFADYVHNPDMVSFPWSMIDKITPRPAPQVANTLISEGMENLTPVITSKNSYVAPFVNAESVEYLVIEDAFPNGRPPLEKAGIYFTDAETVDKAEKMKVCTCLNPLHTALAIFGCLLGFERISHEMKDDTLKKLVEGLGYQEGLPMVINPGIINPKEFLNTVLTKRLPNPFMPDTPQRIATDTSQKLAVRFGETLKAYEEKAPEKIKELRYIPLILAGWLRYLMAVDDEGKAFTLSPDPGAEAALETVKGYELNAEPKDLSRLDYLLGNTKLFGVDLHKVGLADKVKGYFDEMSKAPGAVRKVLEEVTQ